jgi:hypothetical protein
MTSSREAMLATELCEAECMYQWLASTDDARKDALGIACTRIGGGVVTVMSNDPVGGFFNRAIGLGLTEPLTQTLVDDVLGFARENGAPVLGFQVAPAADPDSWTELLAANGLSSSMTWAKFAGHNVTPPEVTTDLKIDTVGPEHGDAFARVMAEGFGFPTDGQTLGWLASMTGWQDSGFTTYGAWDGDDLVGAATLFVHGHVAGLAGAATLSSQRGRGAQSALMVHRMREAAAKGCEWVTCETWMESLPDSPNPSQHNMRRIGLTELYGRTNWVWRA